MAAPPHSPETRSPSLFPWRDSGPAFSAPPQLSVCLRTSPFPSTEGRAACSAPRASSSGSDHNKSVSRPEVCRVAGAVLIQWGRCSPHGAAGRALVSCGVASLHLPSFHSLHPQHEASPTQAQPGAGVGGGSVPVGGTRPRPDLNPLSRA